MIYGVPITQIVVSLRFTLQWVLKLQAITVQSVLSI